MDPVGPPRLRPGVRGAFDEETCRMRLHEIGDDMVHRYPPLYGIQKIYGILLSEYGRSQIADAISVFHDLLEDESYEGHIWRSWRHAWNHRNVSAQPTRYLGEKVLTRCQDNLLNPFVPTVDGYVLPPPTSKRIRALRGANFSAGIADILSSARRSAFAHDENRPSYISSHSESQLQGCDRSVSTGSVVKHEPFQELGQHRNQLSILSSTQNTNEASGENIKDEGFHIQEGVPLPAQTAAGLRRISSSECKIADQTSTEHHPIAEREPAPFALNDDGSDRDSQQDFADVTSSVAHMDDANLLRFEMMSAGRSHLLHHHRTHSGPTGTVVLRAIHSGDSSSDLGRDMEVHRQTSLQDLEWNGEGEEESHEPSETTSGKHPTDVAPLASSEVHERPFAAPIADAEESFDNFERCTFPSTWHKETTGDQNLEFLPDRAYGDENQRMSLSAVKSYTVEKSSPSISTFSDHASLHSCCGDESNALKTAHCADELDTLKTGHRDNSIFGEEILSLAPWEPASPTPGRFPIDSPSEEEVSQIRSHKCRPSDHDRGVTCSRISLERYPIDGHDEGSHENRQTPVLVNRKETQQNRLFRRRGRSFLQRMPKIFQKDRESKQTNRQGRNPAEDASPTTGGLFRRKSRKAGLCSTAGDDSPPKSGPRHTIPSYSFDGACDEDDTASTMPVVDLNKALPPQPLPTKNKTTASPRTDTPSLTHSGESRTRPSTASTGSSGVSRVSSRKRFHRTANELVHPNMANSRGPSPLHELDSDKLLVASKYDPLASPKLPDT